MKLNTLLIVSLLLLTACGSDSNDRDRDSISDEIDNCPDIANTDQRDTDGDTLGDLCDDDMDGDGTLNIDDEVPLDPTETLDGDGDGIGDIKDLDLTSSNPNSIQLNRLLDTGRATKFIGEIGVENLWNARFGRVVANIGDVNGDGHDDLFISQSRLKVNDHYNGRSYLLFGLEGGWPAVVDLSNLSAIPHILFKGDLEDEIDAEMGASIAPMGDLNGDGLDDFMLSAPGIANTAGDSFAGEVYLIFGRDSWIADAGDDKTITSAELRATYAITFRGTEGLDLLGSNLTNVGDINGDGFADVAVTESILHRVDLPYGRVHLLFGEAAWAPAQIGTIYNIDDINNSTGLKRVLLTLETSFFGEWLFGAEITSLGDFNNDGLDDVVFSLGRGATDGEMHVLFGRPAVQWPDALDLESITAGEGFKFEDLDEDFSPRLAWSIVSGDLNGDGAPDLATSVVGRYDYADLDGDGQGEEIQPGLLHILWGGHNNWPVTINRNNLAGDLGITLTGEHYKMNLGAELAILPDWDGDGFDELLAATNTTDHSSTELKSDVVYKINGQAHWSDGFIGPSALSDQHERFILNSISRDDVMSMNVLPDLNGDGLSELTFSDNDKDSNGLTNNGEFYVLYGYSTLYPSLPVSEK